MAPVQAPAFWRAPFRPLMHSKQLVEYVVLDIEPLEHHGGGGGRFALARAEVRRQLSQWCYAVRSRCGIAVSPATQHFALSEHCSMTNSSGQR